MTTLTSIERSDTICRDYSALAEAAAAVASPVLRNMGTLGGNICLDTRCLAYQFAAWRKSCGSCIKKDGDLCHVAPGGKNAGPRFRRILRQRCCASAPKLKFVGPAGTRRVRLDDFYTGEGDARMKLAPNELLTRVFSARCHGRISRSISQLSRGSIDYPLAGVAVAYRPANGHPADARVAITAVNPAPELVSEAAALISANPLSEEIAIEAGDLAARTATSLTTSAYLAEYRREMIKILTKRALHDVIGTH